MFLDVFFVFLVDEVVAERLVLFLVVFAEVVLALELLGVVVVFDLVDVFLRGTVFEAGFFVDDDQPVVRVHVLVVDRPVAVEQQRDHARVFGHEPLGSQVSARAAVQ